MGPLKQLALLAIFATAIYAEEPRDKGKAIGIFNIVKFNNDVCDTGNNNMFGTCFTAEECSDRNGVASGSCADGYGVCCVITLTCGATTRSNCTYLSQDMSTTPNTDSDASQSCTYNICPATDSVRRIRFEMETFDIEGPWAPALDGAAGGTAGTVATTGAANVIGQCRGDQFVASSGLGSSPIICGTNNGQHMVLDTDGSMCVKAMFTFGVGGNQQRSYRIHILQFGDDIANNYQGGPAGCLQYFTGEMGTVSSFNWNGIATSTHLANQNYDVCIRQEANACQICWAPITTGVFATPVQGSFGVSNGATAAAGTPMSGVDVTCDAITMVDSADYVTILGGNANVAAGGANLVDAVINAGEGGADRFCGRYFNVMPGTPGAAADGSVCSRVTPFKLGVHFDDHEAVGTGLAAAAAITMANANEASAGAALNDSPLGIMGFQLGFAQLGCA